jgi:hypothetical protein
MKKYFLILVSLVMLGCSSSDEDTSLNPFINTSWTADDSILSVLHGNGSTTTIEFLTETSCQQIEFKASGPFKGTTVEQGTYIYKGNEVTWTVDGNNRTANLSGSLLISTIVINGNPMTFKKN